MANINIPAEAKRRGRPPGAKNKPKAPTVPRAQVNGKTGEILHIYPPRAPYIVPTCDDDGASRKPGAPGSIAMPYIGPLMPDSDPDDIAELPAVPASLVGSGGRPSSYDPAAFDRVLHRLEAGNTMTNACHVEGILPRRLYQWMEGDSTLSTRFARARQVGFDAMAEQCQAIADEADGRDAAGVQAAKLRVETRLKLLAKWDHKRYGDRIEQVHSMGDKPADMSDAQLIDLLTQGKP